MFKQMLGNLCTWGVGAIRGMTPLMKAAFNNNFEEIDKYLSRGYGINAKDKFGGTALMCVSAKSNSSNMVEYLLERGADVNVLDDEGRSALLFAVKYGECYDTIKKLIENGADVNIRDNNNNSLLHIELLKDKINCDVIKLLIDAGIDVTLKNNEGLSSHIICLNKNISHDITLMILKALHPNTDVNIFNNGNDIFIISIKNNELDGFLVRYTNIMGMLEQINGYIIYEKNKRTFANTFAYENGQIIGRIMGVYENGELLCVGTDKNNMQALNENNYHIKEILDNISFINEITDDGTLINENLENVICKLFQEQ